MKMAARKHRVWRTTVLTGALLGVYTVSYAAGPVAYTPYGMNMDAAAWIKDRGGDPGLVRTTWQGRDALKLTITKPAAGDSFNNWQGHSQRTAAPAGESFLRGDIWIQDSWASGTATDFQNTGMWGSAMPASTVAGGSYVDAQAVFPIIHFTNQQDPTGNPDGKGMLRIWDTAANPSGGWVYLPDTAGQINYGSWNSFDLRLIPESGRVEYYLNGSLVYTWVDPTSDNGAKPGQFFAMYLKARNNGVSEFDTYWSRLMSGTVYTDGTVSGPVSGDVMVDAGGMVLVADGTTISGSLYGNGSTAAASIVNFDKSATVSGDLIGNNTWFNFSTADATATIAGSIELEGKSLASGGSADNAVRAERDIKLNDSTLKGYWTLPSGSIIAQGGARIEDAVILASAKTAVIASGPDSSAAIKRSDLQTSASGAGSGGLLATVNASNGSSVSLEGGSVAATGGSYTRGILASGKSTDATATRVTAMGTAISTTGGHSHAVHAFGPSGNSDPDSVTAPIITINAGTVDTTGDESYGLYAQNGGNISSSAQVTTSGKAGFGAFAYSGGRISLHGGSLETSADALGGTIGTFGALSKKNSVIILNGTAINTEGVLAEGLRSEEGASIVATDSTITTAGSKAHGVTAYTGGTVDLVRGSVSASGANANGLQVTGAGSKITTTGTVVQTKSGKYGAYATSGGEIALVGGSVSNTNINPGSQGIAAVGTGSSITATNVAISAKGEYTGPGELSNAVAASNGAHIALSGGSVSSLSNQFGRGLLASTSSSIDASNVAISTAGAMSNAVHAFSARETEDKAADTPTISLTGGSVRTVANDAYGLSAQNTGARINASGVAISTQGGNSFGAIAYNGAALNLTNTAISTSGAGAHGISINAMSAAQTPSRVPVAHYSSGVVMEGGSISATGAGSAGVYLRNASSVTLNGVTVNAAGPVFSSDFGKSGQSQTITVGAGSTLSSVSDILLRVDRSTAGEDGVVDFTLEEGAFASGNIVNYRNGSVNDAYSSNTHVDIQDGSHWAGIFIKENTQQQGSGVVNGDASGKVDNDVATTTGSSVSFQGVSQVTGSVSTAANSSTTFTGSTPTTITENLVGQQGSSITFTSGANINQSVTGVGSTMSFGGATIISQGIAGSGSSVSFSGPTTISSTGGGNALTGASNTSFSFSRTAPTTINGSVDLSGGSSTHGGTTTTPVTITGNANVSSGAVLGGNLNISGALNGTGGTLGPGNSTGIQTYGSFGSFSGTYLAEVNAAGQSDLIRITSGLVDLKGIALKVGQENGNGGYVLNHDYTIVETGEDNGISGISDNKFASEGLDSSFTGTLVKLDPVKYGADYVKISLSLDQSKVGAFMPTLSDNQRGVMSGLQGVPSLLSAVATMQGDNAKNALNQLSGEVHGSTQSALHSAGGLLVSTVGNRMRGNVGAGMLAGAPMADASGSVPAGAMPKSVAYPLWAEVVGNWNTLDGGDNASKTKSHTAGIYVGGDVPVGAGWRVGGALGFTDGRIKADDVGSRSDVRSYTATVYGGNSWAAGNGQVN
ncbi:MAG TPA: hypothetical protein VNS29_06440, partial [Burkholderiaceae bacterium]|nr:hypothetical protein [Burkholderiaceae bacterium]